MDFFFCNIFFSILCIFKLIIFWNIKLLDTKSAIKDVDDNRILNGEKTCRRTKNKYQRVNPNTHGLIPQLNKGKIFIFI